MYSVHAHSTQPNPIHPYLGRPVVKVRIKFMNDPAEFINGVQTNIVRLATNVIHDVQKTNDHHRVDQ
jgi:hypothetical protein